MDPPLPSSSDRVLTKYEFSRILGLRIGQLNLGATPLAGGETNMQIAGREIKERKLDMKIRRPFPQGKFAYVHMSDLRLPPDVDEMVKCFE